MAGTEVGTAYVTVIPKADGFSESVAGMSEQAGGKAGLSLGNSITESLKSTVGNLTGTGGEMGDAVSGGMEAVLNGAGKVAIVGAFAAIAAAALVELESIGRGFDEMTDTIIVGTGASGDALEELRQNAMSVSQDVAVSFAESGDIIQDFSTRLGLSGDDLQSVATHAAKLDEVLGGINYDKMATMFNVWGVSADEMNAKMDYMFGVAQNTGIGFDSLTSIMQSAGPTLQNLGFSFEESANMAGLLDKAGIDASGTMSKMSRALVQLSQPGESAQDAFRRTVDELQGLIDAGDQAAAMDLASQVFGTRGAAQFIGALQSGALSMDALADAALGASGDIDATYKATESWPELWQRIQNSVTAALEPLGSAVFQGVGAVLDGISQSLTAAWQATEPFRERLAAVGEMLASRLAPLFEKVQGLLGGFSENVGNMANSTLNALVSGVEMVANILSQTLIPAFELIADIAFPILSALGDAWSAIGSTIFDAVSEIFSVISEVFNAIGELVGDVCRELFGDAADTFPSIGEVIRSTMASIKAVVGPAWEAVKSVTSTVFGAIRSVAEAVWPAIKNVVMGAVDGIKSVIGGISSVVQGVTDTFNAIKDAITNPIETAKGIIDDAIGAIRDALDITLSFPEIKLPEIRVDGGEAPWGIGGQGRLPSFDIVWNAAGGIVDGATLIGAGEKGPEAIVPLSGNYMAPFARAIADEMGGSGDVNVYLTYDATADAEEMAYGIARKLKQLKLMEAM